MVGVVGEWTVIESKGDCSRSGTLIDAVTTILDGSKLSASYGGGVSASRRDILGASRSIFVVASGRVAVVGGVSAP